MTALGDRDSVFVPAHRDPEEYLRSIAERDREPVRPSVLGDEPSASGTSTRSRRPLGLLLVGALVVAGATGAIIAFGGGDTSSAPEAAESAEAEATLGVVPAVKTPAVTDALRSTEDARTHVVVAGDTMEGIADQYGVTVEELLASNDLDDANALLVGQRIVLPSDGRE